MNNTQQRRSTIFSSAHTGHMRSPLLVALLIVMSSATVSCRRSAPAPAPEAQAAPPPAPTPPPPAPTVSITASSNTITAGGSVTLEWESRNANSVQIQPGIGTVAASGSRAVSPASSVSYTATATGPGGTATAVVRVTVNTPAPAPVTDRTPPPLSIEELFRQNVQTVYFDFDRADIRTDQIARLQASARFLSQNAGVQFTISGHADDRGSQEYNIGLGDRRANAVRQYLIGQGVAASRINTVSFGEERPTCQVAAESCWSQNRRGDFAIR